MKIKALRCILVDSCTIKNYGDCSKVESAFWLRKHKILNQWVVVKPNYNMFEKITTFIRLEFDDFQMAEAWGKLPWDKAKIIWHRTRANAKT